MTMKLTALYTTPTDPAAFEQHYATVHIPLVAAIPGLIRQETALMVGTPDGTPAAYYRQADLYFPDMDALGAGFASAEGQKTADDAAALAARTGSTLTLMVSTID
ncbi:MAG TPA: EthD family reductase [Mycobacteriales bacterium]|jgi:uncharacterized protein (TIGR02118 family)|nr:EthD family reductase [Mycobacteriales bacterium]